MALADICGLYKVATDEEEGIRAFISTYDGIYDIVPYLHEVHGVLRGLFGKVPLLLTMSYDPESIHADLFIIINTDISTQKARNIANGLFDRFNDEYWLDTPASVRDKVGVDLGDS